MSCSHLLLLLLLLLLKPEVRRLLSSLRASSLMRLSSRGLLMLLRVEILHLTHLTWQGHGLVDLFLLLREELSCGSLELEIGAELLLIGGLRVHGRFLLVVGD